MLTGFDFYDIQKDFIKKAKAVISSHKIGIFSSPTGTGKTLSLLCSISDILIKKSETYASLNEENKILMEYLFGKEKRTCKIFYCSRTHTQLNQAIKELKRVYPTLNSIILGSRKVYCQNEDVKDLKDLDLINEKCSEYCDTNKCMFYNNLLLHDNSSMKGIYDLENMEQYCKEKKVCSYFVTRKLSSDCDIIFMPYNLLFTKDGRASINIELKDSVVMIDEAHNIYDTIIQMNTVTLSIEIIQKYYDAFIKYKSKYEKRLTENNMENIKNIINILKYLVMFMSKVIIVEKGDDMSQEDEYLSKVPDFLIKSGLMDYKMLNIDEYIRESRLTLKLEGFNSNLHHQLYTITRFLKLLVIGDEHGRIFYNHKKIKYTTLDPKNYITDLLECRSILLAGGTMEPIKNLMSLFSDKDVEYYRFPTICTNFVSYILSVGPSNKEIILNYDSKNNITVINEILKAIYNLSHTVKRGGIICFIPSKNYLKIFKTLLDKMHFKRKIIFETEHNFEEYKKILKKENVIYFCIMGGKLSEGINFNDDLCRLLIIIGIPFPTLNVEMKERLKYHGPEYSKLIAMKTVNQALGRAMRHKDDYSAIVLIDKRYKYMTEYITPWIGEKIRMEAFGKTLIEINKFLNKK